MQQQLSRRTLLKLLSAAPAAQGLTGLTADNALQDAIAKTTNYRGGVLPLNLPSDGKDWLPSNLMTFALGRGVEYYDAPAVRKIVKDAEKEDYRFSSLILGIVKSVPFQMRRAEMNEPLVAGKIAGNR